MANSINNLDNILDVRDIIERFEELESELEETKNGESTQAEETSLDAWITGLRVSEHPFRDAIEEYEVLRNLLEGLKGNGGDEQWRGDWYPVTLIHNDYFEEAMDDLIQDCYTLPELPGFITLTIDYKALQMDYTSIEIEGQTFWYR